MGGYLQHIYVVMIAMCYKQYVPSGGMRMADGSVYQMGHVSLKGLSC
jgi:hypothetical protein